MRAPLLLVLAAVPLMAAAGAQKAEVSFARDVQPIFNTQCVMCHNSWDPHGGLYLDPGFAHSQLVDATSSSVPELRRVAPGRPDQSYLIDKLNNTHLEAGGKGWWMPPPTHFASAVTARDKMLIRKWIEQGAKDN